jgi:hypothetical protein
VGQCPSAKSLAAQLAAAFGQAADEEQDPDRKSRLRQVASFLAETGKDVAAEVLARVILRPAGLIWRVVAGRSWPSPARSQADGTGAAPSGGVSCPASRRAFIAAGLAR